MALMPAILLTLWIASTGCNSPGPLPITVIEWVDIIILPSGSLIIFPKEQTVYLGQTEVVVSQFTTDTSCVIFTNKYLNKIHKTRLEQFE